MVNTTRFTQIYVKKSGDKIRLTLKEPLGDEAEAMLSSYEAEVLAGRLKDTARSVAKKNKG